MERNGAENGYLLSFDERSETWYVETGRAQRLELTRASLEALLGLYNSIHTGRKLLIEDERTLRRLEDRDRRLTHTVRDLYLALDAARARGLGPRIASGARRWIRRLRRHGDIH